MAASLPRLLLADLGCPRGSAGAVLRTRPRPGGQKPHRHAYLELVLVDSGRGVQRSAAGAAAIAPGSLLVIPPGAWHELDPAPGAPMRNLVMAVSADLARRVLRTVGAAPWPARPVALAGAAADRLRAAAAELEREGGALAAAALLLAAAAACAAPAPAPAPPPAWLQAALAALERPAALEAGLPALLAAGGRSRWHLARACRRSFGETPTALVNRLRIERAAGLIAAGRPVLAAALAVGLAHQGHFHALFRARYGCTPRQWRLRRLAAAGT